MDADHVHAVSRALGEARSRRGALAVSVVGLGSLLGLVDVEAGKRKKKKKKKKPSSPPPPPAGRCYATVLPGENLQAVISAAAGDVNRTGPICLTAGTYPLAGMLDSSWTSDLSLRGATLEGAGQGLTILQGSGVRGVISSSFAGQQLKDLTITGGVSPDGPGGGVSISRDLTMTNCTVTGNTANSGGGIQIAPVSRLVLDGCTITGNTAHNSSNDGEGGGVVNRGTLIRTNTTISGNTSDVGPDCFNKGDGTGC